MVERAGLPDPTTYVEDDHFTPVESDQEVARFEDPTPEIEARQDALLVTTLRELSGSASEVVESLATDGGQHYTELAENTETSASTIYRALRQLDALARNDDGNVDLASEKLRQEIVGIVERTDDHLRSAADRACKLVNLETRQAADSALQQWMKRILCIGQDGSDSDWVDRSRSARRTARTQRWCRSAIRKSPSIFPPAIAYPRANTVIHRATSRRSSPAPRRRDASSIGRTFSPLGVAVRLHSPRDGAHG